MAVIKDGICVNDDNTISFGDYTVDKKIKIDNYEFNGDVYKVRSHNLVTRLEKNEKLLIETVPGATVHNFIETEDSIAFKVEGSGDTQITLELEPKKEYRLTVDSVVIGDVITNISGKLIFSAEAGANPVKIVIEN